MKIGDNEYNLSDVHSHKNDIIQKLKNAEDNDLNDMVFKLELTYYGNEEIFDTNEIAKTSTWYSLLPVT